MTRRFTLPPCFVLALIMGCSRAEQTVPPEASIAVEGKIADRPPVGAALRTDLNPTVLLRTSEGMIKLRLDAVKAPLTVDNFLTQVDSGFYDKTIFHQVEAGYVILGGGFQGDLAERKSRYSIPNEASNGLSNRRGTIAMARPADSLESGTGQFFINVADNPDLDRRGDSPEQCGYCVFGEVVEGLDVVDRIAKVQTRDVREFVKLPVRTVLIEGVTKIR
ncbi:MAG TPA: peptidylprolyl isomerase [Pirellulales bacterium]|jgi:cyclophilin family peptidyl-prolyl cis-trans isomerase